ncbi:hypothetical protein A9Q84_09595 [Halobacteriovorax marinus]|uniref:Uncharacterized protein n=1 Tax=Halobacteriovorax marinus TaxID=97084 RepID=A0A1Y5FCL0_9BACT|nr:hypothetical protein A9Q84_09595 [Halobacteriovorax marinus]
MEKNLVNIDPERELKQVLHFSSEFNLYIAIKVLLKKDATPMRQSIYNHLLRVSLKKRILAGLYSLFPHSIQCLSIFAYTFLTCGKCPAADELDDKQFCFFENPSELKAVTEQFSSSHFQAIQVNFKVSRFLKNLQLVQLKDIIRIFKFINLLTKRFGLLYCARVTQLLIFSFFTNKNKDKVGVAYFSSDASPFSLGIISSLNYDTKTLYTPHGILPRSEHLLLFKESSFSTKYNFLNFQNQSLGMTHFLGEEFSPSFEKIEKKKLNIGIICSLTPNKEEILKLVKELSEQGHLVHVRAHPNQMGNWVEVLSNNFEPARYDLAICGNTGHTIKLLNNAIPVLYSSKLDYAPYDIYSLIEKKVLIDILHLNDVEFVLDFYNSHQWREQWKNI